MKAAYIRETGRPEVIQYDDVPTPEPAGSEVRVKVGAVSVNPIDTYIRSGMVAFDLPKPFVIGSDVAGVVDAVGPDTTKHKVGDRVWGSNQGVLGRQGTFSEYVVCDEGWLYPTPDGVDDRTAAALALVGITSHLGLVPVANLQQGESIFIHGGSCGVGSTVVQMAKALGARVITTGSTDEKVEIAKSLGADVAFNYKKENVAAAIKKSCPEGVNVYWELLREQDLDHIVDCVSARGRIVLMAGRGSRPELPVGAFYVKGCTMHGFAMFNFNQEEQAKSAHDMNRWLKEGKLKAQIDRVLPISESATAHRLQEESTVEGSSSLSGKLVLEP